MNKVAILCSVAAVSNAIIPGGIGGGVPLPAPMTTSTAPVPIARNAASAGTFDTVAAGSDEVSAVAGSYGPLPPFLKDATAYLPTTTWDVDQGMKLNCESSGAGETYPCVYYIVFQNCARCTDPTNGGLTELSARPGFSFETCSPRFTPAGTNGESYPTAFFKAVVPRGQDREIFMDRPATAFAVFDGTETQCPNLLSQQCVARPDCMEIPSGGCTNADTVCPPRLHRGPFVGGGGCPSCWEGGL